MIEKSIAAMHRHAEENLRGWWQQLFAKARAGEEGFGIYGPSSYVFCVNGRRFMVDPALTRPAWFEQIADIAVEDMEALDGIILTHTHSDHYDRNFIRSTAEARVKWYVPEFFGKGDLLSLGVPKENIVWTNPASVFDFGGVQLSFFESNHRNEGASVFLRELGYVFAAGGKRYVSPCDVRNYNEGVQFDDKATDILLAHLWLGKQKALQDDWQPMVEDFCRFLLAFHPKRVTLAHLYDTNRTPDELWTYRHAGAVMDKLLELAPAVPVTVLRRGEWYTL